MRHQSITLLFVLLNIAFSSASFLQRPVMGANILAEIQSLESDDFGKKIMDTVALQMKNKAPLEDVSKLLTQIKDKLIKEQQDADALDAKRSKECKTEIAQFKLRISHANKEIREATENIAQLTTVIAELEAVIANEKVQLQILGKRHTNLVKNHQIDIENFKKRKADHANVLSALGIIIPKLKGIPSGQVVNAKTLLVELSKIGHSNPISALVQLAMTLDPKALQNVINKLEAIKSSLEASMKDDMQAQVKSNEQYEQMIAQIKKVERNLQASLSSNEESLSNNKQRLSQEQKRLSDNQAELKSATEGLEAKVAQCTAWKNKYIKDTKQRNEEIMIVSKVQAIMATKLEQMKGYLKQRVNKI